jgi:MFS family permease
MATIASGKPATGESLRRWAVIGSFMFVNLTIQTLWISYSPIAGAAAKFYGVSDMLVSAFAMVFMVAFVPLSIPVSWSIDRFGFRWPVTVGALLMGACGVGRGLAGNHYALAFAFSLGLAVAQPFLLNAWTKVPANWLPRKERASAVGLITLASLVGTALGQLLPPMLLESGIGIGAMQLGFGLLSAFSAVVFLLVARERPEVEVEPGEARERALMLNGIRYAFSVRPFVITLAISFVGLGFFNGVNTWIEPMIRPRGFTPADAGLVGAIIVMSGLFGAVLLPALSDREGKRRKYLMIGLVGCLPGILGLTFATSPLLLYASAAELGFFLVSVMPIAMQYASEITWPTPEGTSNGLIQLFGQGAVVFVYFMGALRLKDGSFTVSLLIVWALFAACAALAWRLPERRLSPQVMPAQPQALDPGKQPSREAAKELVPPKALSVL